MESITPDTRGFVLAGQGEACCDRGKAVMEGGVETGNLRQVRANRAQCTNGRQVVRLVKWRQGHKAVEPRQHLVADEDRGTERVAAMDDPVAGGDQTARTAMALDPREEIGEKRLVSERGVGR